ncbi:MAG: CvpA family protein [Chloroflexi bacterium]|nr:CvpA family protein [Chloroflexota bacterium]
MNWLDFVLLIIFVVAAIGGAKNGLIKSVVSLVALVAALVLAVKFYVPLGSALQNIISNQTWARVVAFVLILVAIVVAGSIVGSLLHGAASAIGLGIFDRIGGSVFSLIIAVLVFGGIMSFLGQLPVSAVQETIRGSAVASLIIDRVLPLLGPLSPFFKEPSQWPSSGTLS